MPRFLRQFGLRTLLLVCFLAAVAFGLVRWHMDGIHRQHAAVKVLLEKNASVQWYTSGPQWLRDWVGDYYFTEVIMVHLQQRGVHDDDLLVLEDLPAIERLYLPGNPKITDAGLDHLRGLKHLRRLSLWGTGITDQGLAKLSHLKELEALDIKDTQVTQTGLARLAQLPKLTELYHRFEFTDDGLVAVAQLPAVQFDLLKVQTLSERGFAQLRKIRFSRIELESQNVRDWPRFLYHHPTMDGITLSHIAITDEQAEQLFTTNDLSTVVLVDVPLSDKVLPSLAAAGKVIGSTLKETKISANGFLQHFGDREPTKIYIDENSISMSAMGIPWLNLEYTGPVPLGDLKGLAGLRDADYFRIHSRETTIDLRHLPPLPSLTMVWINGSIDETSWKSLARQPSLQTICVRAEGQTFTPAGFKSLKDCKSLQRFLLLETGPLTDEHLSAISACDSLQLLAFRMDGEITPQGIGYLMGMPQLTKLGISFSKQTDTALLKELAKLKQLEELTIFDMVVTDEMIDPLVGMSNLKILEIHESQLTPAGMQRLRKEMPKLEVRAN